jgi:hypothetical protein
MTNGSGSGRVDDTDQYELKSIPADRTVSDVSAVYNPLDYSVTLTIDTNDPDWTASTWYYVKVDADITNICGTDQGGDVYTLFRTQGSTPTSTPAPTPTGTLAPTATPACLAPEAVDGTLPDGFVVSITPDDGAAGVPLSTTAITVVFGQPMKTGGAGGADETSSYGLKDTPGSDEIPLMSASYDPATYTATIIFDNTDDDWLPSTWYYFVVKSGIQNACDTQQGSDVVIVFSTADPVGTAEPTPTPTYTPAPTSTPTDTPTYTPTPTDIPTPTPLPTSTATETPLPTDTPVPTDTPIPSATP